MLVLLYGNERTTQSAHRFDNRMRCDRKTDVAVDRLYFKEGQQSHCGQCSEMYSPKIPDEWVSPKALGGRGGVGASREVVGEAKRISSNREL